MQLCKVGIQSDFEKGLGKHRKGCFLGCLVLLVHKMVSYMTMRKEDPITHSISNERTIIKCGGTLCTDDCVRTF